MQESRLIKIDFYARLQNVSQVGLRGKLQQTGIAVRGNHEAHIDFRQRGDLQDFEQAVGGEEIGRLYINVAFGIGNGSEEREGDFFPFA